MILERIRIFQILCLLTFSMAALPGKDVQAASAPAISISYAYYDPLSLIIRDKGWLQDVLGNGTKVTWTLSQGSNKALEFLRGNSIQFGQAAGSAAFLARANGTPARIVVPTAKSEWTAIVVRPGSPLRTVEDLKGHKIAVTPGTDPYIFLLRVLSEHHLKPSDVTIVPLQHPLGRQALDQNQVDAWVGLDPFMAEAQIQNHDVLLYRNPTFITPDVLLVRDSFSSAYPEQVKIVADVYTRARAWAKAHPDETATILTRVSGVPLDVAKLELSRTDYTVDTTNQPVRNNILSVGTVLKNNSAIANAANVDRSGADLFLDEVSSR